MIKTISLSGDGRAMSIERCIILIPFVIFTIAIAAIFSPNKIAKNSSFLLGDENVQNGKMAGPIPDIVFVSRQRLQKGAFNLDSMYSMPGVGPNSRFRPCIPGKLQIRKQNFGALVTLIDGSNPNLASLNLVDVNGPDVSYDGTQILFAGLVKAPVNKPYNTNPENELGAWRIYKINKDGTGLTQLTFTDITINSAQFNAPGSTLNDFSLYDDIDPIWLPDGRICFVSTRYPGNSDYATTRVTNLFVMNADGTNMHRITTEANGAERPVIDPITGQIVYSRWWRNSRFPFDNMATISNNTNTGFLQKAGLGHNKPYANTTNNGFISFNGWTCTAINPDGTNLHLLAGRRDNFENFQTYGCSFTSSGEIISNYFPDDILFFESGFGGIRKHARGAGSYTYIAGYTGLDSQLSYPLNTPDTTKHFYSIKGYASDVTVLPDNRIIFSSCQNNKQEYGIYICDSDGTNRVLIYNKTSTAEMRAKPVIVRSLPPVITDQVTAVASAYPPLENGPYNIDGNFTFKSLNVYANGPIDMDITSAPRIGEAGSIRFFISHQRKRSRSDPQLDWPILLKELTIPASGEIITTLPANQPLFEQLRTPSAKGYKVPITGLPYISENAHVAGMNFSPPGTTAQCIGCHRGHTMIPLPANLADAEFTNLAPGATLQASQGSTITSNYLIDRKSQLTFATGQYWNSDKNNFTNQWVKMKFPVSIKIKNVRLFNVPFGGIKNSTLQLTSVQVLLYSDTACTQLVASKTVNQNISVNGTDVTFNNIIAKGVQVKFLGVTGMFNGFPRVACAEIEVIASGSITTPKLMSENTSEDIADVDVFPNPTTNDVNINVSKLKGEVTAYAIYDLNGKIVSYINLSEASSKFVNVDLSSQQTGVYFVKLFFNDTESKTVRVMKF